MKILSEFILDEYGIFHNPSHVLRFEIVERGLHIHILAHYEDDFYIMDIISYQKKDAVIHAFYNFLEHGGNLSDYFTKKDLE